MIIIHKSFRDQPTSRFPLSTSDLPPVTAPHIFWSLSVGMVCPRAAKDQSPALCLPAVIGGRGATRTPCPTTNQRSRQPAAV
jgi:hypothetical protein